MEHVSDYSKAVDLMLRHSSVVKEDSEYAWVSTAIEKIARWFIQCDQLSTPEFGHIECMRVVRIRRGIPKYALNTLKISNDNGDACENARTFLGGIYMVVRCIHISAEEVDKFTQNRDQKNWFIKLPDELKRDYLESTFRFNSDGSAIVLAKSDITDWVYQGSHYQMLEVNDI